MEEKQEAKKVRRKFTAEQKFEILQEIERGRTIKEGISQAPVIGFAVSQVEAAVGGWSAGIVEKWPAIEASGSEAIGGGESKAQGGGVEPGAFDQ